MLAPLAAVALAVLAGLVVLGRWERQRWVDRQAHGMEQVEQLVGPLDQPGLVGFRVFSDFDCLIYRRGPNPFALELCVDRTGRVVEAIDRRTVTRHYYSLRADPSASPVRQSRAAVDRLLRKMGAA